MPYSKYRQSLKQSFSKIPLIFQDNNFLPTDAIYIELALSNYSPDYQNRINELSSNHFENLPMVIQERQIEKEIRKLSVEKFFRHVNSRSSVVLGDPGSGKTTLLKTIAYRSALGDGRYPQCVFYIELKKFKESWSRNKSLFNSANVLIEYIVKVELGIETGLVNESFAKTLNVDAEEICFLIDGWDEIAGDRELANILSDAIRRCSDIARVVLTSRRAVELSGFSGFDFYEVVELSTRSIKNYIANFAASLTFDTVQAQKLANNIMGNAFLLQMAQNPFLLSLVCFLKSKEVMSRSVQYVLSTKVQLYDAVMKEIQKEVNQKGVDHCFDAEALELLSKFSFELFNYQDKTKHIFSNADFKRFAQNQTLPDESYVSDASDDLSNQNNLNSLNNRAHLLGALFLKTKLLDSFDRDNEIYFVHLTFQEYLAALELSCLPYEKSCRVIETVLEKVSWRQVLRFYAGILNSHLKPEDADKKFAFLLRHAWNSRDDLGVIESQMAYWFQDSGIFEPEAPYNNLRQDLWKRFDKGMECAELLIKPALHYWNNELESAKIVHDIIENPFNIHALKKIFFIGSSASLYRQKQLLTYMLKEDTHPAYVDAIANAVGGANRVDLIETYGKKLNGTLDSSLNIPDMPETLSEAQILKLLKLIASTKDPNYYPYIACLLQNDHQDIVDKTYETLITVQAAPFFDQIETFALNYAKTNQKERLDVLRFLDDELAVQILDRIAKEPALSLETRLHALKLLSEDIDPILLINLDKTSYLEMFKAQSPHDDYTQIKKHALWIYSKILALTPTETLRKEFDAIKAQELYILNIALNPKANFSLRLTALGILKTNRLRGITLFEIFMPLEHLIFDTSQNIELQNAALEVLCEQSIFFKDLSLVKGIFERGIQCFETQMLSNTIFFIGQYGYTDFTQALRQFAKGYQGRNEDNEHNEHNKDRTVQAIAIQALGDLKDQESTQFIYDLYRNGDDSYLKEIAVESLVKLEPKLLLRHQDDAIVYRELCRYAAQDSKILRRDMFLEEQYG
jgi:hypothetical protein